MSYKVSDFALIFDSDGKTVLVAEEVSYFDSDNSTIPDTVIDLPDNYVEDYFNQFRGSVSGYSSGGQTPGGAADVNTIDKFPFSSDANATDVGDLSQAREAASGQSSDANGYTSGGIFFDFSNPPSILRDTIDKFPFSSDGNATDVGNLTAGTSNLAGQSSSQFGYISGGSNPSVTNVIEKFAFATDGDAIDVGDLTQARGAIGGGQSSGSHGYTSGGNAPPFSNVIDKFPFASEDNATDVGDLTVARRFVAGQSSGTHGYTSGGTNSPTELDTIDKFSFATDGNATDVGDLSQVRSTAAGQSSQSNGYTSGGVGIPIPSSPKDTIDKFPFSSDANATDVGNLTQARSSLAGQQN